MKLPQVTNLPELYDMLRPIQQRAADVLCASGIYRGQIILPTGVGKTLVQVYAILKELTSLPPGDKGLPTYGVALMASHRILLCEQLILETVKVAMQLGIPFNVLTVASNGIDEGDVALLDIEGVGDFKKKHLVKKTTSSKEVLEFAEMTKKMHRMLLVVCTYQSMARLAGILPNIACMDEAHTTTEEDKHGHVGLMLPSMAKAFFFTATSVTGCNGRGMDSTEFYGQVLNVVAPRAAIDSHDILPPMMHTVRVTMAKVPKVKASTKEKVKSDLTKDDRAVIQAAYKAHREIVLHTSKGKVAPKLLISVAGVKDMVALITNVSFNKWALQSGVQVIAFSSGMGYYANGLDTTRKEALERLRGLKENEGALILHYDILTEGIDLPNITGVLPLRELNKVKFLQLLGRAARLQKDDRILIYADTTGTTGSSVDSVEHKVIADPRLLKPVYWVIHCPQLNVHAVDSNLSLVEIIREAYEVSPEERNQPETSTTSTETDAASVLPESVQTAAEKGQTLRYEHDFEALVFKEMTEEDKLALINDMLDNYQGVNDGQEASQDTPYPPLPAPDTLGAQAGAAEPATEYQTFSHVYMGR